MKEVLKDRYHCTGCAACEAVCPTGALKMDSDKEHFLHPTIDEKQCIHCGLCSAVCNKKVERNSIKGTYAAQIQDDCILSSSTSGGIVTAICNHVIQMGGVAFAATYSVDKGTYWTLVKDSEGIDKIRGSKYLQIGLRKNDYEIIRKELHDHHVLVVGTPCQIEGIRKYLKNEELNNLIAVDIVCGGVISPQIERYYEAYLEKKKEKKVSERVFRGKRDGLWERVYYSENHYSDGTHESYRGGEDLYTRAYTSERLLRESCYRCEYTSLERTGDLTIGDCWGIEKEQFVFPNTSKGVSLVIANTDTGLELLHSLEQTTIEPLQNKAPIKENKPLHHRTKRHRMRNVSYDIYNRFPFNIATNIVCYRYNLKKVLKRNT